MGFLASYLLLPSITVLLHLALNTAPSISLPCSSPLPSPGCLYSMI